MVKSLLRAIAVFSAIFGTLACSLVLPDEQPQVEDLNAGPPQVELTTPLDGATYLDGISVNVTARVSNAGSDIDRVEILVDNVIVTTVPLPNPAGAPIFTVSQNWTASSIGNHTLGLTVFRTDGTSSETVTRNIKVVESLDMALAAPAPEQPQTNTTDTTEQTNPPAAGAPSLLQLFVSLANSRRSNAMVDASMDEPTPPVIIENQPTQEEETVAEPTDEPETVEEPTDEPANEPTSPTAVLLVGANVRSGPDTAFLQIGSMAAGTETPALAVNSDRTWYKITYWNGEGWVSAQLLEIRNGDNLPIDNGPPPPTAVPTAVPTEPPPPPEASNVNLTFNGSVTIEPFPPKCKQTMKFTAQIANDGSSSAGSSSALLIRDTHLGSGLQTITRAPIPDIGAGDVITVSDAFLTVDTNFDSDHKVEVIIDIDGQVNESNESDNTFTSNEYRLEKGEC